MFELAKADLPLIVTRIRCIPIKKHTGLKCIRVFFLACETTQLLSVVIYAVSVEHKFDLGLL